MLHPLFEKLYRKSTFSSGKGTKRREKKREEEGEGRGVSVSVNQTDQAVWPCRYQYQDVNPVSA